MSHSHSSQEKATIGVSLFFSVALVVPNYFLTNGKATHFNPCLAWLLTAVALILFINAVGIAINWRAPGIIIDNRNRVSLSKFQAVAWTVLILSAMITTASYNLWAGPAETALDLTISNNLLAAMGISAVSVAATPAILSLKTSQPPEGSEAADASAVGMTSTEGKIAGRKSPKQAQWVDMFRGDEVSNVNKPDLSKIQQFLITVMLVAVYGASLWAMFAALQPAGKPIVKLPDFNDGFAWLMGISHAGYLAYKAVPHSRTTGPAGTADGSTEEIG